MRGVEATKSGNSCGAPCKCQELRVRLRKRPSYRYVRHLPTPLKIDSCFKEILTPVIVCLLLDVKVVTIVLGIERYNTFSFDCIAEQLST